LVAQLATLATTAALGVSIAYTPPKLDAKLTVIEQTMSAKPWALAMLAAGLVGLVIESFVAYRKSTDATFLWLVSICHIICMSVMLGYSLSAVASLVRTGHWYAFGGPVLGLYIALMHYVYIKRRYTEPLHLTGHRG
jgi:FtsH-binding integral membrane protein